MHDPNWAEAVQAITAIATLFIAVGGIFLVLRQLRQVERTIQGTTHERLTAESFEVLQFLASIPNSYPYFYNGKPLDKTDENFETLRYATEFLTNYLEHVVLQRGNMKDEDWPFWRDFVIDTLHSSPAVLDYLRTYWRWYADDLIQLAREAASERPKESTPADF
jgi:hypothetical protein